MSSGAEYGRARADFDGDTSSNQLSFRKDDVILVTNQLDGGCGSALGRRTACAGTFRRLMCSCPNLQESSWGTPPPCNMLALQPGSDPKCTCCSSRISIRIYRGDVCLLPLRLLHHCSCHHGRHQDDITATSKNEAHPIRKRLGCLLSPRTPALLLQPKNKGICVDRTR